jgi:hypothetical protein
VLSGGGLCDELIAHPEESYRLRCVVVCDLETSRIGAPYIYDISNLRVKNGLKQDGLFPLPFNCALEYAIRRVQVNQDVLKLNGTHQCMVYN